MAQGINREVEFKKRLFSCFLTNNHVAELAKDSPDLDCCFMTILGWGRSQTQRDNRTTMEDPDPTIARELLATPPDFYIAQSSRVLELNNEDLWLGEEDSD